MPLSLLLHSDDAQQQQQAGNGTGHASAKGEKERQSSLDSNSLLSPGSSETSWYAPSTWLRRGSSPSAEEGGERVTQAGSSHNPMFPSTEAAAAAAAEAAASSQARDPLGRKIPAALPSYLKIPTLIPSTYASPTSSASSSPPGNERELAYDEEVLNQASGSGSSATTPQGGPRLRLGGKAAEAILNTQDVVLAPGEAGKVSSPLLAGLDTSSQDSEMSETRGPSSHSDHPSTEDSGGAERTTTSRTPTPTPGSHGNSLPLSSISGQDAIRRPSLQLYTGTESGTATPALPIGLTSAPSSALTPAIPTYNADGHVSGTPSTPLTKETNNLNLTLPQTTPTGREPTVRHSTGSTTSPSQARGAGAGSSSRRQTPLVPIQVVWRGGGKEVFVTGTFANEWRSKILLRKSPTSTGRKSEYTCVLHLAPGTHRLKFIVDDRWRVSRDLSTASDGEGNLTNYIEVAHTGPAHPGPLSAPGEDMLAAPEEEEEKRKRQGIAGHKATYNLMEEARRAEALQRGSLLDVFGDDNVQEEEHWTQEIPPSIIKAQAAEEAHRNEIDRQTEQQQHGGGGGGGGHRSREQSMQSDVPAPPSLPRQLEKVILNSTSASVLGTVDDNSVLPAPNHAILHHLTASAIKSGVIATGCTVRYRKKYITTVYYRAAS